MALVPVSCRKTKKPIRFSYPAVTSDLVYLVSVKQLSGACQIAIDNRLQPISRYQYLPSYASDFTNTRSTPQSPCNVLTLSRAAACATFVRMAAREHRGSDLRHILILDLAKVLTYGLFGMSYDGDYMEFKADDEPERERAVDEIKRLGMRLVAIVAGQAKYEDLPYCALHMTEK
ncbi:hypothetical protein V2W45_1516701 [Cenococcum geophilum]